MNHTLLIADDEELIRQGIIARLEYLDIKLDAVYEASSGRQALEIMEEHEAEIVITDIRMGDMDGLSFIKQAKPLYPKTQFIILSGYNDFSYAEIAGIMGINPLTVKWKLHNAIKKLKSIILIQGGVEDCQGVT
jgi:YesN/AraC family two-component response regulator